MKNENRDSWVDRAYKAEMALKRAETQLGLMRTAVRRATVEMVFVGIAMLGLGIALGYAIRMGA
jgi:hypothetical protein